MTERTIAFDGVEVTVPSGWVDITESLEGEPPITLAKQDGVGALQFSIARYANGKRPRAGIGDVVALTSRFGTAQKLGTGFDERAFRASKLAVAGVSFRSDENLLRVWYASDGDNFAMITYVVAWED